jgi:beta-N-acetylhexosaminidase
VTNVRSLGDDPERVAPLAQAWIKGMQASGELAACAKHFPGDGVDDRDQHACTSVNSLTVDAWRATYGRVWAAAIEAGVLSVMVGHIAFPDYEGLADDPPAAAPATLSSRLQVDLLRGELGFEGVIVSDAAPMIGISSRVSAEEKAIRNILSGSDVFLFADPRADFARLLAAIEEGRLGQAQLDASVRRVLEMKARLGLHRSVFGPALTTAEREHFRQGAAELAERSITLARANDWTPVELAPGARVLTVTVKHPEKGHRNRDLPAVDAALARRGFEVDHLVTPPAQELIDRAGDYACVFVNLQIVPHALMGTIRLTGDLIMPFWNSFWTDHPNVVFTSFGSPYHLYELPHLPNMVLAYGPSEVSQEAAVRVWLGEIEPRGVCPVKLPVA